ncbi:MAG: iron(III) transport system permease protein [Petrotoga sp.]|jgi:iron(III) transport system permease protein|nr:iron(III) transport system permease protein [Petrotoga sp.]
MTIKKERTLNLFLVTILVLVLLFIFLLPIVKLVYLSFLSPEGVSFSVYQEVLTKERTWKVVGNTLVLSGGATVISLLLGTLFAVLVAYSDLRYKHLIQMLILLPLIIPSYIIALSWAQLMGPNGLVAQIVHIFLPEWGAWSIYSMEGMVFVLGISHYPLVYLLTLANLRQIPRELELAARTSGASKLQAFMKVTLPLALPGIANGGLLSFLASLDNFGIPAFLGIPANISVLSTYIYEQIVGFGPTAFARAAVLSVLLGCIALFGTGLNWMVVHKSHVNETEKEDLQPRFSLQKRRWLSEGAVWTFLLITSLLPLISLFLTSLVKAYGLPWRFENLTFKHYLFVLSQDKVIRGILNSFFLAITTALILLVIGTWIGYMRTRSHKPIWRLLEGIIGMPYALPGIVTALAIILVWLEPIPGWNPGIYGSKTILLIAYITRFSIIQVRASITAFMQVDPSIEEAARISGSSLYSRWRKILLPLIRSGVLNGSALVILMALTELTLSSILTSSGNETIGVIVFNYEQAGYTTNSTAISSIIVFAILGGMLLFYFFQHLAKKENYNGTKD